MECVPLPRVGVGSALRDHAFSKLGLKSAADNFRESRHVNEHVGGQHLVYEDAITQCDSSLSTNRHDRLSKSTPTTAGKVDGPFEVTRRVPANSIGGANRAHINMDNRLAEVVGHGRS